MNELESTLQSFSEISFRTFKSTVDSILQKHAPIKKRSLANQASFIYSKEIRKEIMRKRKENIDSKTDADRIAYNKQRNYCVGLILKEKSLFQSIS